MRSGRSEPRLPEFQGAICKEVVGAAGLEPATLCLEGRCSIQLSYAPTANWHHFTGLQLLLMRENTALPRPKGLNARREKHCK
jgi:hypothetical protein